MYESETKFDFSIKNTSLLLANEKIVIRINNLLYCFGAEFQKSEELPLALFVG